MRLIDLTGQRFGKLTVIRRIENRRSQNGDAIAMWECQCDCGNKKEVNGAYLRRGEVTHCGCERKINVESKTRFRRIYMAMKRRCYDVNNKVYPLYGGRGIKMCDEWLEEEERGYFNFKEWSLNNGYQDNLSIDRIDNNGNYSPDNCRWVNMKVQNNNKRSNVFLEYNGEIHTKAEWADILGVDVKSFDNRIRRGNTPKEAIETPFIRYMDRENKELRKIIKSHHIPHYQIAEKMGIHYGTLAQWMQKPLTEEKERQVKEAIQIIIQERNVSNGN